MHIFHSIYAKCFCLLRLFFSVFSLFSYFSPICSALKVFVVIMCHLYLKKKYLFLEELRLFLYFLSFAFNIIFNIIIYDKWCPNVEDEWAVGTRKEKNPKRTSYYKTTLTTRNIRTNTQLKHKSNNRSFAFGVQRIKQTYTATATVITICLIFFRFILVLSILGAVYRNLTCSQ